MKILMVSNLLPPDYEGGQEINALKLAIQLKNRGHEVDMVTSKHRPKYKGGAEDRDWVHRILTIRELWHIPDHTGWRNKFDMLGRHIKYEQHFIDNYKALKSFLNGRDYDVAYVAGLGMVGRSLVMAMTEAGIPVLYHSGDNYLGEHWKEYSRSRLYDLAYSTFLREVKRTEHGSDRRHFAFVSKFLADEVAESGIPMDKVHVIPRGIEFPLSTDLNREREQPPIIMMGGRLTPDKGYHVAVEAFVKLHKQNPEKPWRVEIYGKESPYAHPTYVDDLKATLESGGASHRVEFMGQIPREALLERYRVSSVFLSASTHGEPFGNIIIESLALGTPLVGARVGSIEEVVVDGEHALLYESEDVDGLVEALIETLDNYPAALDRAQKGVKLIDSRYRIETIMDQTEALLAQIATTKGK